MIVHSHHADYSARWGRCGWMAHEEDGDLKFVEWEAMWMGGCEEDEDDEDGWR